MRSSSSCWSAWCGGFLWFLSNTYRPSVPPAHADGIVVLTGGGERLHTAFQLLAEQRADRLLISGVPEGVGLRDVARSTQLPTPPGSAHVTVGHQALTTLGNAQETAAWVTRHGIRSLIVGDGRLPYAPRLARTVAGHARCHALPDEGAAAGHL